MSSRSISNVNFFYDDIKINIRNKNKLKVFIKKIIHSERKTLTNINIIFTTDKKILKINRAYLNHNFLTDVIAFQLNSPGNPIASDIYISIDRVRENALSLGQSTSVELHRVVFHGVLHLCGYRDKTARLLKSMRLKEDLYLKKYFNKSFT